MKKILNSKWTALNPKNKEKHFIVTKVFYNEENPDIIDSISVEAVLTKREFKLLMTDLMDSSTWAQGWK